MVDVVSLAYSLLGVITGVIFLLDGWRSNTDSDASLNKSPKIKGLIFVLGGGIFPAVQMLATDRKDVLALYALAFVATTLTLLFTMALYADTVSFKRIRDARPFDTRRQIFVESLPYVFIALQEGLSRFRDEIDKPRDKIITDQRDAILEFWVGAVQAFKTTRSVDEFLERIKNTISFFLLVFLEHANRHERFRASIYYQTETNGVLKFLLGVGPVTAAHSRQPLPSESLAGYAIQHPDKPYWHFLDNQSAENAPFSLREGQRYHSVVARAIKSNDQEISLQDESIFNMVLCIDCVEKEPRAFGDRIYIVKLIQGLAIFFADMQVLSKISNKDLSSWVQKQLSPV